jgi:hypothetical protein
VSAHGRDGELDPEDLPDDGPPPAAGRVAPIEADPADVQEQQQPVGAVPGRPVRTDWMDADEADALEQSLEVPLDDDERP